MMPDNLCIHGFKVSVKSKTLKRRSSIVKHSRFLRNMEVTPVVPNEPEAVEEAKEGEEEENEDEEN
jgi:hypothetical protein